MPHESYQNKIGLNIMSHESSQNKIGLNIMSNESYQNTDTSSTTECNKPKFNNNYDHSFNVELACKYGERCAILLQNFVFWTRINYANGNNLIEGRYWTYNTIEAFKTLFPYWTTQNIRTIIKKLIEFKLIQTDNFNNYKPDRKLWYALTDFGLAETGLIYPQPFVNSNKSVNMRLPEPEEPSNPHSASFVNSNKPFVNSNKAIADTDQQILKKPVTGKPVFSTISEKEKEVLELLKNKFNDSRITIKQMREVVTNHDIAIDLEWSVNNFLHDLKVSGDKIKNKIKVFAYRLEQFYKKHGYKYYPDNSTQEKAKEADKEQAIKAKGARQRNESVDPSHKHFNTAPQINREPFLERPGTNTAFSFKDALEKLRERNFVFECAGMKNELI